MKFKLFCTLIACFLFLAECKNQIPKEPVDQIFHIKVDNTQDFMDLKLSNLVDSIRLVALETSKNVVIQANDFYVSKDFILAFSQDGIYKFSAEGKFLKKIAGYGRGPDEIMGFGFSYFCDENKNLLYISDMNVKQKLLVYDLIHDKFITPVKKSIPGNWNSFSIYNDSLILGIPAYPFDSDSYTLFFQSINGKFISGIPHFKKVLWGPKQVETFQNSQLTIGENTCRISFAFDDTLFTLKNNHLVPYIILDFKKHRESPPNAKVQKGDRQIRFPRIEAPSFLIISVSIIEEITWFGTSGKSKSSYKYFFFDKSTGKSSIIRTYEDDFSGVIQSSSGVIPSSMDGTIKFPVFLKNDKLVVVYQPSVIKKIAEKEINPIFDPNLKNELLDINKNLKETDNAILLIGIIKEKM